MAEMMYKLFLSGSTNGRQIKVAATSSAGTVIHTTSTTKSHMDEIWLYAHNTHTANVTLTLQYGGTTSPDDNMPTTIAPGVGIIQVIPGLILNSGLIVRAYASTANVVMMSGFVCRNVKASTL